MNTENKAQQAPILYDRKQAAEFLGVSIRQVDHWIKAGSIKPVRLGRLVKIHPDELLRVAREGIPSPCQQQEDVR